MAGLLCLPLKYWTQDCQRWISAQGGQPKPPSHLSIHSWQAHLISHLGETGWLNSLHLYSSCKPLRNFQLADFTAICSHIINSLSINTFSSSILSAGRWSSQLQNQVRTPKAELGAYTLVFAPSSAKWFQWCTGRVFQNAQEKFVGLECKCSAPCREYVRVNWEGKGWGPLSRRKFLIFSQIINPQLQTHTLFS